MEAIQIIAYLSLLALANCQERMAQAMPMVNVPDQNKDRGVEIIVNYLTGQKDNYTSLQKRVQDLEAQVADLVSNARSYTGSTNNDGNTNCGCPRGPVGPVGPSGLPGPIGPVGPPGPTGYQGSRGERGAAGGTGATGATGQDGRSGATGRTGSTGATGQAGSP